MNQYSVNKIDLSLATGGVTHVDIDQHSETLQPFNQKLTDTIMEGKPGQIYEFSETSGVKIVIETFLEKRDMKTFSRSIADRLYEKERHANSGKAERFHIKSGDLFISVSEAIQGEISIIFAKIDSEPFIDRDNFVIRSGLPIEKHNFRACLIMINGREFKDILVSDTKGKVSDYWWQAFLELTKKHTDIHNTNTSFSEIRSFIQRKTSGKFRNDYFILKNNMGGYFSSREQFDIEDFISFLLDSYDPVNEDLPIKELKKGLGKLPEKKNFDKSFSIEKSQIKNKLGFKISLTDDIDLSIKRPVDGLENILVAEEIEGQKCVIIKSNKAFNSLKESLRKDSAKGLTGGTVS